VVIGTLNVVVVIGTLNVVVMIGTNPTILHVFLEPEYTSGLMVTHLMDRGPWFEALITANKAGFWLVCVLF